MEYLRPKTIEEALTLLAEGVPLGGGTRLVANRQRLSRVIDLQSLGLDGKGERESRIFLGAMTRLQDLLAGELVLSDALREACRYEAAWNIRNQATLGGVLMSADGRSPLLTALAALHPEVRLAPGDEVIDLATLFDRRRSGRHDFILMEINYEKPSCMAYDFVARAPMDPPIVSAAAALFKEDQQRTVRISIGGFGDQPQFWEETCGEDDLGTLPQAIEQSARKLFQNAGDAYASAEYRAEIAGILARRVVCEVIDTC